MITELPGAIQINGWTYFSMPVIANVYGITVEDVILCCQARPMEIANHKGQMFIHQWDVLARWGNTPHNRS